MTQLSQNSTENMTHQVNSSKNKKKEIRDRREKVSDLIRQGYSEKKIAEFLDCSRETVVRDIRHMRKEAVLWADKFPNEFFYEYKVTLDKLKDCEFELQKCKKEAGSVIEKVRVIKALHENLNAQMQLLTSPVIDKLRKIKAQNMRYDLKNS